MPSPASFEAPYSEVWTGNGASSGVGKTSGSPYTEPVEENAILRHAGGAHRLEHVGGRDRVLLEVPARVLEAVADVGVGLQVEHPVAALERALAAARSSSTSPS